MVNLLLWLALIFCGLQIAGFVAGVILIVVNILFNLSEYIYDIKTADRKSLIRFLIEVIIRVSLSGVVFIVITSSYKYLYMTLVG